MSGRVDDRDRRGAATPTRRSDERAVYIISVAAELAGMHPQTLRIYERRGLLRPARTSGNTRRYSDRDIRRLQEIARLTQEGVSLAGVKLIVEMEEQMAELRRDLLELRDQLARARRSAREARESARSAGEIVPLSSLFEFPWEGGRR